MQHAEEEIIIFFLKNEVPGKSVTVILGILLNVQRGKHTVLAYLIYVCHCSGSLQ